MKEEKEAVAAVALSPLCTADPTTSSALSNSPAKMIVDSDSNSNTHLLNGEQTVVVKEECCLSNSSPQNGTAIVGAMSRDENGCELTTAPNNKNKQTPNNDSADQACFKTPAMPSSEGKKARSSASTAKKRQKTATADYPNGKSHGANSRQQKDAAANSTPLADPAEPEVQYSQEELLRDFVSIGKHSFLCPRSQQFLAKRYQGLRLRKVVEEETGKEEDLIDEIVIDEFSLLLFRSMDDYNLLKEREDKLRAEEEALERQRLYEENLRLGKIKKKGRKSKADLKREKKEARKRARQERKEQHRREREERRQRRLALQPGGSGISEEQLEKRRERREQRRETKLAEREKRREEKKRQKQTKKLEEKRNKRVQNSKSGAAACSAAIDTSTSNNPLCLPADLPSSSSLAVQQQQQPIKSEIAAKIESKQQNPFHTPIPESAAAKRPSSVTIGIATARKNGLIRPPSVVGAVPGMPASKLPKLEVADEFPANNNRGLLIGIANAAAALPANAQQLPQMVASEQSKLLGQAFAQQQQQDIFRAAVFERDLLQRVTVAVNSLGGPSQAAANIAGLHSLIQQDQQLQQTFSKNPEFAQNFFQSLATLKTIDTNLAAKAAPSLSLGHPSDANVVGSPTKAIQSTSQNDVQQQLNLSNSILAAVPSTAGLFLSPSFPLGVPLASQLATLAASQSAAKGPIGQPQQQTQSQSRSHVQNIPFKNARWCNMHATIAHEIDKHQEVAKKAGKTAAIGINRHSTSRQQERKTSSTSSSVSQQGKIGLGGSNASMSANTSSANQLLQLQQQQQQAEQMRRMTTMNNISQNVQQQPSQSAASTANLSIQQQLATLMGDQRNGRQHPSGVDENILASSLLGRLPSLSTQPSCKTFSDPNGLLPSSSNNSLGLAQMFSANNQSSVQSSHQQQLFGGFPIQPLGPGSGSLTSGNSSAAAAAQLQQQAQLLALIQQQQNQLAALQAPAGNNPSQISLAASLLAQLGAANGTSALGTFAAGQQQQQPNLLSTLVNQGNSAFPSANSLLPTASSLPFLASLPNVGNLPTGPLNSQHGNESESILAAFLSGQSFAPKISFPPPQPATSSANPLLAANNPALSIEQLMRSQFDASHHQLNASNPLFAKLPGPSTIPPAPSSLISHSGGLLTNGAAPNSTPMNPIEQELLMRQLRFASAQQPQLANGPSKSGGLLGGAAGGEADNAHRP